LRRLSQIKKPAHKSGKKKGNLFTTKDTKNTKNPLIAIAFVFFVSFVVKKFVF